LSHCGCSCGGDIHRFIQRSGACDSYRRCRIANAVGNCLGKTTNGCGLGSSGVVAGCNRSGQRENFIAAGSDIR